MNTPASEDARLVAVDAVRGFALLGILVMNIVAFGLPFETYDNPTVYGGASGADAVAWMLAFAIADGKMRGLFTMLFGVSLLIVADAAAARGDNPAKVHYRRMGWLLVIGILHGYLVWYGDILVEYALTGAVLFVGWRWRPVALFYAATVLFAADVAMHVVNWVELGTLQARAMAPGAPEAARSAWHAIITPDRDKLLAAINGYRGGFAAVMRTRLGDLALLQQGLPVYLIEALGTGAFGMALYRSGYFSSSSRGLHRVLATIGLGVVLPATLGVAVMIARSGFAPVTSALGAMLSLLLRPMLVLGYASGIILLVEAPGWRWLSGRLAAAGRMAITNYLAMSVVMTTLFYGYGFGLFAHLARAELYLPVIAMWGAILLWSRPWLQHFRYGPVEWLWRSLARGALQPMRQPPSTARRP